MIDAAGPTRMQRLVSSVVRAYANYLPAWRGKWRLLRPLTNVLVSEVRPNVWIHVDPRVGIERTLLYKRLPLDYHEIEFLWDSLRPGMTVVDVGAFIGVMALVAAKKVASEGRVLASEAGPSSVARLARNRQLNKADNVTICAMAIGGQRSVIEYNYCVDEPDGSSVGYSQEEMAVQSIIVPMVPLDECLAELTIDPVDLIKIDVEGAEPAVLAGARATLSGPQAPLLVMEVNPGALEWAGNSAVQLIEATLALGYELQVLEVAASRAYANVIGLKPGHRERFPSLENDALMPLLTHEWYRTRVLGRSE